VNQCTEARSTGLTLTDVEFHVPLGVQPEAPSKTVYTYLMRSRILRCESRPSSSMPKCTCRHEVRPEQTGQHDPVPSIYRRARCEVQTYKALGCSTEDGRSWPRRRARWSTLAQYASTRPSSANPS
jgi:hypothetical protein